jgi:hypothetical protein
MDIAAAAVIEMQNHAQRPKDLVTDHTVDTLRMVFAV